MALKTYNIVDVLSPENHGMRLLENNDRGRYHIFDTSDDGVYANGFMVGQHRLTMTPSLKAGFSETTVDQSTMIQQHHVQNARVQSDEELSSQMLQGPRFSFKLEEKDKLTIWSDRGRRWHPELEFEFAMLPRPTK